MEWARCSLHRISPTEFALHTAIAGVATAPSKAVATFKAQTSAMARQWMSRLQEHIDSFRELQRAAAQADEESPTPLTTQVDTSVNATVNATLTEAEAQSLEHGSLLHPPKGWGRRALYGVSLPLLLCFAATVPDVRQPRWKRCFPVTLFMAVVWLAVLAELMMRRCVAGQPTAHATAPVAWLTLPRLDCSAEDVACLLDIPGDVMGLTITAGGTSLPNLFASVIVAQQVSAPPAPRRGCCVIDGARLH